MRIIYFIPIILAAFLAQSCGMEEDSLFSESSADRISGKTAEYKTLLESAPKGWLLEYGVGGSTMSGGGHNILVTFKDGNATMATDADTNVPAWTEETAPYSVNMETGPVLSFDMYNPVIHYFTEPHPSQLTGQDADFEFIIMGATDSTVILQGKKYHTTLTMKRLPENFDSKAFKEGVDRVKDNIYYMDYTVANGGETVGELGLSESGNVLSGTVDNQAVELPFVYTASGIQLLDTLHAGDKAVTALDYDTANKAFENKEADIKLAGKVDERYDKYVGTYLFSAKDFAGVDVTLTPLKYGRTYKMTGYSFNGNAGDFTVKYENGQLAFAAQTLEGSSPLLRMFLVGGYLQSSSDEELVSQEVNGTDGDYSFVTNGAGTAYGLCIGIDNGTGTLTGIDWSNWAYLFNIHLTKK